jgi:hypothetical protein
MTVMSRNEGRRTSAWPLVAVAGLLAAAVAIGARWAAASGTAPTLFVTNANSDTVVEFPAGTFGNLVPAAGVGGSATGLLSPSAIAVDASGNIYVANFASGPGGTGSITVYSPSSNGNVSPSATIVGTGTQLAGPQGIALDSHLNIYVANLANTVTEYAAGSTGNATPTAVIAGTATQLAAPAGIAVDASGRIYVANLIGGASTFGSITVYAADSKGNATPVAAIAGSDTGLSAPQGIAVDGAGNIFVANLTGGALQNGSITVYASGSNGNVAPSATISGPEVETLLLSPQGLAVDSADNIYVANTSGNIAEYASGSSGPASPLGTISGSNTGLNIPRGIALPPPTPAATATATRTATATPTETPSNGGTPPPTPTTTATATPTATATKTATPTATATKTATPTATPTATATKTATPTATATSTGSVTPTATATRTVTPTATPTATATSTGSVTPTATATRTATPTATPTGRPTTAISVPGKLKVGKSTLGNTVSTNLDVKNTGKADLFVYSPSMKGGNPGDFATGASTCPAGGLAPNGECTIAVRFTPSALGARSATLTLHDNAGTGAQNVALSGTGLADVVVSPASIAYGKLKLSAKKSKTVKVKNAQPVGVVLSKSITGSNAGDFAVTGGTCTSTLGAKARCTYIVTFTPGTAGALAATLSVTAKPDLLSPHNVSLTGTGK